MKKSEILKSLRKVDSGNVTSYYRMNFNSVPSDVLVIYVYMLDWRHIRKWGKDILDITSSGQKDDTIRIAIENVEFD